MSCVGCRKRRLGLDTYLLPLLFLVVSVSLWLSKHPMSYIQFLGAAGVVTGSKHLIHVDNNGGRPLQVLVDCGLFQGQKEWRERNWQDLPVPAKTIDAVILTHAHLDHCGWIPRLVKEGFHGPIYATPPTIDLCGILLPDSGHLQEEDAAYYNKTQASKHHPALPLYTEEEAQQCLTLFHPVNFGEVKQLTPQFSFRLVRAAHILGSGMVEITLNAAAKPEKLIFTGDIGRVRDSEIAPGKVVHSGPTEGEDCDVLVMESTYGNREHPHNDPRPQMAALIRTAIATRRNGGGAVICRGAHAEVPLPVEGADGERRGAARAGTRRQPDGDQGGADLPEAQ